MTNSTVKATTEIRYVFDGGETTHEPACVVTYEARWQGKKVPTVVRYKPIDFDRDNLVQVLRHMADTIEGAVDVVIEVPPETE